MSKINKTEVRDGYKQRPVQNFPDYLKYVAKKSRAGFGKVHEELYRIYSESFGTSEKPASQTLGNQQVSSQEKRTSRSKVGLRQRWSNASLFWSSTGHDKLRATTYEDKSTNNSFVSYIPEEKDELDSSTGSNRDYDIISDDLEMTKQNNRELNHHENNATPTREKDKKDADLNSLRFSMPYSKLTDEAIYINDRVIHVEKIDNLSTIEEQEDIDQDYAIPKVKHPQQTTHEKDDYVNLRDPCEPLATVIDKANSHSRKKLKDLENKSHKINTIDVPRKVTLTQRPPYDESNTDDDNEYLPPTNWTQSCYEHPSKVKHESYLEERKVKEPVSTMAISSKTLGIQGNPLAEAPNEIQEDETDEYYVLPAQFKDADYENIPKALLENKALNRIVAKDNSVFSSKRQEKNKTDMNKHETGNEADYDRPVGWVQPTGICTEVNPTSTVVLKSVTDIDCHQSENSTAERTDNQYTKIVKDKKRNSEDADYSVPTWTKLAAKDYSDSGDSNYSVPKGIRPINSGNSTMTNDSQAMYATPRSTLNTSAVPSKTNHQNAESESVHADINSDNGNRKADFYHYTVDEVVDCLNDCALTKLANICKADQLDGEYLTSLTTDELKEDPFNMNWYHISKLIKVIDGWRPKHPLGSKEC
ncbi:uncharacterized protein LOC132737026 [Ruditapes philippinarum]|uniref:uncharacterized protein LOC132737026 n=1 Tax=Ruditapes philippinarum TaxID=129788 RepID=UPI00295B1C27|nr:uncharacterized protein LOC132737026 [Ruditapes philippinarum]